MNRFPALLGQKRNSRVWLAVAILLTSLLSCSSPSIEMQIQNSTSAELLEVEITNHNNEFSTGTFSLTPGEKLTKRLDFSKASVMDGSYILSIGSDKKRSFGYYTNGTPLEKGYHLEIRSDTIIINSFEQKD